MKFIDQHRYLALSAFILGSLIFGYLLLKPTHPIKLRERISLAEITDNIGEIPTTDNGYSLSSNQFSEYLAKLGPSNNQTSENDIPSLEPLYNEAITYKQVIPAGDGGEFRVNNINIVFPAGYYDQDLTISYTNFNRLLNIETDQGHLFDISAYTESGESVHEFTKNIEVTAQNLAYDYPAKYFDERNDEWIDISYRQDNSQTTILTDHFTLFAITDPEVLAQASAMLYALNNYDLSSCTTVIDDSDGIPCFNVRSGNWFLDESVGYNSTTVFTSEAIPATVTYLPNQDNLDQEIEIFVTVPELNDYELTTNAYYFILHKHGIERLLVDQQAAAGQLISLGNYEFSDQAAVAISNSCVYGVCNLGQPVKLVADAVSFGGEETGGIGANIDLTKPKISDAKVVKHGEKFIIQAVVTDTGSGLDSVFLSLNGEYYEMTTTGNDIYSILVDCNEEDTLDYYIIATDKAGNSSTWHPTYGYVNNYQAMELGFPKNLCSKNFAEDGAVNPTVDNCNSLSGDPINTANGNFLDRVSLFDISGRSPIDFNITYNSRSGMASSFGYGWTHSYNYKLIEMDNAHYQGVFIYYPDGRLEEFVGDGLYPENDHNDNLTKQSETYILTQKDQTRIFFDQHGDISRIEDRNSSGLNFEYSDQVVETNTSALAIITTDTGQKLEFIANSGLIEQISGPEDITIAISYDNDSNLTAISKANSNIQIPIANFEYNEHLITTRISPEGHPYYRNSYDDLGRVTKQIVGETFTLNYQYSQNKTTVTNLNGYQTKYEYDDNYNLIKHIDEEGHIKAFEYDTARNITAEIDNEGNRYEYGYDTDSNRTKTIDPLGQSEHYEFNQLNQVTKFTNKLEHITSYQYNSTGNLKTITNNLGDTSSFIHNQHGQISATTDFGGNTTRYFYDSNGNVAKITDSPGNSIVYSYDNLGRLLSETNRRGYQTSYEYDINDNLTKITGPLGTLATYEYDLNNRLISMRDANSNQTNYEYDNSERQNKTIYATGSRSTREFGEMNELLRTTDEIGNITEYLYDQNYRNNQITIATGTGLVATTSFELNSLGIPLSVTDAEGNVTETSYDPLYRITNVIFDAENLAVTNQYEYSPTGKVTRMIDPNGVTTSFNYDELDRLTEKTSAVGTTNEITEQYSYDSSGNVVSITDPNGHTTSYKYDGLNQLIEASQQINESNWRTTRYQYDANGNRTNTISANGTSTTQTFDELDRLVSRTTAAGTNVTASTNYEYDLADNLISTTDPKGTKTAYTYDALNRVVRIRKAVGTADEIVASELEYDAASNVIKVTDANGNSTNSKYDILSRLTEVVTAENQIYKIEYDRLGNKAVDIDPKGARTEYKYDGVNRLTTETMAVGMPEQSQIRYSYDQNSNLVELTDANGNPTKYKYDNLNRLTTEINAEGDSHEYRYDTAGNLKTVIDPNGNSTGYFYDYADQLVSEINALGDEKTYHYDLASNLTKLRDENGHYSSFQYDALNRLTNTTNAEGYTTKYAYDLNGNLITQTDARGVVTAYIFDPLNRNTGIVNAVGESEASSSRLQYDPVGNLITRIAPDGVQTAYGYDRVYRLTSVTLDAENGGPMTAYDYDPNNNLVSVTEPEGIESATTSSRLRYDALKRLISETNALGNTWQYEYDKAGNLTSRIDAKGKGTQYTYFPDNQLKDILYESETTSFAYDAMNNLISMTDKLGTTTWTYDGLSQIRSVNDANSNSLSYQYDSVGNRTALIYPNGAEATYEYQKNNWLKSASSGQETVQYQHDAIGNITKQINSNGTHTTQSFDALGRMISTHSIDSKGDTINSFDYSYNNVDQITQTIASYGWQNPGNITTKYSYDNLRRLVSSRDSAGIYNDYTYDANSNRTSWTSNDSERTPKPFDEFKLEYEYNQANQLIRIVEEGTQKPNKPVIPVPSPAPSPTPVPVPQPSAQIPVVSQTFIESAKNFENELETQKGKQIPETAYIEIRQQLDSILAVAESGLLVQSDATDLIETLRDTIEQYGEDKVIKAPGIVNSLLVKLDRIEISSLPVVLETTGGGTIPVTAPGNSKKPKPQTQRINEILFDYDNNGNRIRKTINKVTGPSDVTNYGYDYENRLTQVKQNVPGKPSVTNMAYDGMGRRLLKSNDVSLSPTKATQFVFDGWDPVSEVEKDKTTTYMYGAKSRIVNMKSQSGTEWFYYDVLGSVAGVTGANGLPTHNYRYDDFGSILPNSNPAQHRSHGLSYTGQFWDQDIEMYEFYSRAYDPVIGVWNRADEYRGRLTDPQSLHRYYYVLQDPINNYDEYGYVAIAIPFVAKGAIAVGTLVAGAITATTLDAQTAISPQFQKDLRYTGYYACGPAGIAIGYETDPIFQREIINSIAQGRSIFDRNERSSQQPQLLAQGTSSANSVLSSSDIDSFNSANDPNDPIVKKIIKKISDKIADGHAWDKHVIRQREFPSITSKKQFAKLIRNVIEKNFRSRRFLRDGGTGYWDNNSGTLVIFDPRNPDLGTTYVPTAGINKFYSIN